MFVARYGNVPEWKSWLSDSKTFLESTRAICDVSEEEAVNVKVLDKWPLPGQMKNQKALAPERQSFLNYVYDWYYKEVSQDSHLSWSGVMRRSAALLPGRDKEDRDRILAKHISDLFATTMILCLAIMSEIELTFRFGLNERLKYVWNLLNPYWGMGEELYKERYAALL